MRRTKEDAEQTRLNLLEAAEQVFGKQGFAATRLSDIATEAGVTRGAIYHHFGNKMELFVALHKEKVDPYFKLLQDILDSDIAPKDRIRKMLTELLNRATHDIRFATRQRFDIFRDLEFLDTEEIHDFMHDRGEKFFYLIVKVIKKGQEINDIRQDISAELAALNLLAYIKGLVSLIVMEKHFDGILGHTEEMVDIVLKGF